MPADDRTPRWELVALALLAVILLVRYSVNFLLDPPFFMDFEVYRATGLRVLQGQAEQLYAPTYSDQMLFKYAPVWALWWAPFGLLSSHDGGVLWSVLSAGCLVLTCWLAARLCRSYGLRVPWAAPFIAALFVSRPLNEEFPNGQVDTLWGLLIVASLWAVIRRDRWVAAGALALAISLKLPAALLLLYFLARRQLEVVWRTCVIGLLLNGVAALLLAPHHPWGLAVAWVDVLRASGPDRAFEIGSQSLLALFARYLTNDGYPLHVLSLPRSVVVPLALAVEMGLFACLLRGRRPTPSHPAWLFDTAAVTVMMVLFSPTCWLPTYTLLAFPCVVAVATAYTRAWRTLRDPGASALLFLTLLGTLFTHRKAWHLVGIRAIGNEEYVFLVIMTLPWCALALVGYLWRQRALVWADSTTGTERARP